MSQPMHLGATTGFSKLPAELKVMIYHAMMPGPRRVHMTFRRGLQHRLGSSTPIPAILHLNRDARYEGQKKYKLMFGTNGYVPLVYFNPAIDVLFLGPDDRSLVASSSLINTQEWPCHRESSSSLTYCESGCGHHELDFFWRHVANSCSETLQNISIDLRINRADIQRFFHRLADFKSLKKVIIYHPEWDDRESPKALDDWNVNYITYSPHLYGTKMWDIAGFVKEFGEKQENIVVELALPGMGVEPTWYIQNLFRIIGVTLLGRQLTRREAALTALIVSLYLLQTIAISWFLYEIIVAGIDDPQCSTFCFLAGISVVVYLFLVVLFFY